jgi:alpha-methylacyl-CoA racemase
MLDGGAHFYAPYATRDGKYITVAAVEARFYRQLVARMGLEPQGLPEQNDPASWPAMKARFTEIFMTKTRDEWVEVMEGSDACFSPVLDLDEAMEHPMAVERQMFGTLDGVVQPMPAPRFSQTPSALTYSAPLPGQQSRASLLDWGVAAPRVEQLIGTGVIKALDA